METKKVFKKLYKRTSTGAIQQWQISVEDTTIVTAYGQVGGKIQTTLDPIAEGKNIGRVNETTPRQQALAEAKAQWTKKKKAGYVENLEDAELGKTDSIIKGGIVPMTAKVFEERKSKVIYPGFVQPKLDGIRCICISFGDKASLWSRTRKPITSCPHIEKEMAKLSKLATEYGVPDCIFDGELYNHDLKDEFEEIVSAVRSEEPSEESMKIQYHIYDIVIKDQPQFKRADSLFYLKDTVKQLNLKHIKIVETKMVLGENDVDNHFERFLDAGYEGAMYRDYEALYANTRSDGLLKIKKFQDAEFEIVGVEEGRGKLKGHAGAFICHIKTPSGAKTFKAKMSGDTKKLKEYLNNFDDYVGSMLTVQYQGYTNTGLPRFPVGLRIRESGY